MQTCRWTGIRRTMHRRYRYNPADRPDQDRLQSREGHHDDATRFDRRDLRQHHSHPVHRRGSAGEIRPSGHADGDGAGRLHAVAGFPPLRSGGSDLAEPRSLRAVGWPCLDPALFDAAPDRRQIGRRKIRAARHADGLARRSEALPPARQQMPGSPGIPLDLGCRDDDRAARPGDCDQRRHGDRGGLARAVFQQAGFHVVRLRRLRAVRRRLHDGGGQAARPPRSPAICSSAISAGSTTATTSRSRAIPLLPSARTSPGGFSPIAGTCSGSATPTIASGSPTRSRSPSASTIGRA